jgi:trimethylamine--corrinoid protein Co-methyltransferase
MPEPNFVASTADLERIHLAALRILDEIGIRMEHDEMRGRLAGLGCRIAGARVTFPPDTVGATLAALPSAFRLHGRSPDRSLLVSAGGPMLCTNSGILPYVSDLGTGAVRGATLADVEATTRLLDALPNIDLVYVSLLDATDQPAPVITLVDFAATLANTTKPLIGPGLVSGAEAEAIIAIARALRGPELASCPVCVPFICPISPLRFPAVIVDALTAVAQAGLPLEVIANPVMGVTSPYTIAGTVALGHAEVLAAAVMAHAVRPGLPILNANTPSVADMHTLTSTTGGPETGLIRRTVAALARHLGVPSCLHGHTSSARPDFQAGDEKALNTLLIAGAGPSILGGAGALANVTLGSYEMLVLDDERLGAVRRALSGVAVDDDHLGLEVIARAAAGDEIVGHDHTLRHLRGAEVWRPRLAVRMGLAAGAPPAETSVDRARATARRILDSHLVPPLPADVRRVIAEVISAYAGACDAGACDAGACDAGACHAGACHAGAHPV